MVLKTTHRNLHILKLIIRLSWLFMKKVICSFTGLMHMVKNWVAIFNPWLWLQTEVFDNTFSRKYNRSLLYATILWPWYEESDSKICFILDIKLIKKTEYQEISASSLTLFKFSTTLEGKSIKYLTSAMMPSSSLTNGYLFSKYKAWAVDSLFSLLNIGCYM